MKLVDFLKLYSLDATVQALNEELKNTNQKDFLLEGLKGSSLSVLAATLTGNQSFSALYILEDREEAHYFLNDLQNLLPEREILFFPTSYKKPYEFEETENANVLQRAEVLNRLNLKDKKGELVVTYPEALTEKVISKKTLIENTLTAKVGEKLDINFISELLTDYEFEKSDFVYEPGQFAIRGGIVDIFSFGNELPYRLELFGDEIESIRSFNPDTQLSVDVKKAISIIPNVQNKLIMSSTESFLRFYGDDAIVWIKNKEKVKNVIEDYFRRATSEYDKIKNTPANLISTPEERFETWQNFEAEWQRFRKVYLCNEFKSNPEVIESTSKKQNKRNTNYDEKIKKIFAIALVEKNIVFKEIIKPVSETEVSTFKNSLGIELNLNFNHTIDNSGINYALKNHGNIKIEEKREQIALVLNDFLLIPDIIDNFDIIKTSKNRENLDVIHYEKEYDNDMIYVFEEIRRGKNELAFLTMYKKNGSAKVHIAPKPNVQEGLPLQNYKNLIPKKYSFKTRPQPYFNKDFNLLCADLAEKQGKGYTNYIVTESLASVEKLKSVFEEIDNFVKIQPLGISLKEGFIDDNLKIVCYTDHQIFDRFYKYKSKEKHSKSKAITLKELRTLQPGDYVTHADYGIAKFVGLEKIEINGVQQEAIRLLFKDNDLMKVSILVLHKISKYSGKDGEMPTMSKLGSPEWENKKRAVKKKVKEIAIDLIGLYAKRKAAPGFAFSKDNYLQAELETSFIYEDTPDQAKATEDVKADMEKAHPMDRLVCGDVGFGKTEVAIRAAFKAVCDSKQVAVLVPTTILAMQHFKTFRDRLEKFPCKVEYVNRFRSAKQVKETLERVADGKTDILIGTHMLLGSKIKFKNLGLMIIDEEQKFGVAAKEKLKEIKYNVDSLTLTATPIPRTLHFSLMGARDLSIIGTPPPNRQPVTTEVHTFNENILRDAVATEIKRGGQVFFVHNRVSDLTTLADTIKRLVPDAKIVTASGQMEGEDLEKTMLKFIDGEADVLVSTNIIESGLDIPNANTILINNAHHFGLSDLHQMRGRVGRSNKKAFCYLLAPPKGVLTGDAKKKLSALEEFSELGDGFKVAMRDLDIRGAGNLLGGEQSGFITDIGYDLYHKILNEAIQELKENEFKALFEHEFLNKKDFLPDCAIETDLAIVIPEMYVSNISERLGLYNELDNLENETALGSFITRLTDRFGPMPSEVTDLIETVKLRWKAEQVGFDKLTIKGGIMKCTFAQSSNKDYFNGVIFGKILTFVQKNAKFCTLKENKDKLTLQIESVKTIHKAFEFMESWL